MKEFLENIKIKPLSQHFWDIQYKSNNFALMKIIFLQPLVDIIFRYHFIFFRVLGPPTNKMKKNKNFTYGVLGIKIG